MSCLGLDHTPDRADTSQGVEKSKWEKKPQTSQRTSKKPPCFHAPGRTCESAVFRDGKERACAERFHLWLIPSQARGLDTPY